MNDLQTVSTDRLLLRRPSIADSEAIFSRYASDAEVTRYVGWPCHRSIEDTRAFVRFSESEWGRWPVGPYLIELRREQRLIGSTGLAFDSPFIALTGYVLARDSWGCGYASEALMAIIAIARELRLTRLYAHCHVENVPSIRVLEKCGFAQEALCERPPTFPNLQAHSRSECLQYALAISADFDRRTPVRIGEL